MADRISKEHRSWVMSRIRGKHTGPEIRLRSLLHSAGYRFRLHDPKLPGKPDIVLRKYRTAIFVNGCFWHRHKGCPKATDPKSRTDFWKLKFAKTVERDRRKRDELLALRWQVITVWECELEQRPQSVVEAIRGKLKVETSHGS